MNKKIFMSLLSIMMVAMLSVCFVSCGDDDDDNNPLVGTWYYSENGNYYEISFYSDLRFICITTKSGKRETYTGPYRVNGNQLTIFWEDDDVATYTFSISNNTLRLIEDEDEVTTFLRQ